MTVETPFNITALRDVVMWVEKEAHKESEERSWDQSTWVRLSDYAELDNEQGYVCGTVACVAGHLVIEAGLTTGIAQRVSRPRHDEGGYVAAEAVMQVIDLDAVSERFGISKEGPWVCSCGCGDVGEHGPDWPQVAEMILGVTPHEASRLFSGSLDAHEIRVRAEDIARAHGEVL